MVKRTGNNLNILFPLLAGIGLLFVPLLGDFHIESAILASLAGCFWAGIKACGNERPGEDLYSAMAVAGYLFLAGLPLLLGALLSGCFSVHGLAFWLIYPLPSVFFGYAIGRLLRTWGLAYRRSLTMVMLLGIGAGTLAFEFFSYPQVYFFNHVWGGWAGPIYDETITVSGSAVYFRSMTILWALVLWHIPSVRQEKLSRYIVGLSAVALGFSYSQLAEMGVISPPSHIQAVLGGSRETEHFQLYYDRDHYSEYEISLLAREHEFYLEQIASKLKLEERDSSSGQKIESYLYANPWQKKRLVGAKFTSYVPVWLARDQLHIASQQVAGSLGHELVHIAAKQFGNTLINASWSIGLVEGLAVAVDGSSASTTTVDQLVAAQKPYPGPAALHRAFSPWGFYSGRSGVNYLTAGSFVQYLLERYPVKNLKQAYRTGNIAGSYPQSWQRLTRGWHRHLDSIAVDSTDRRKARQIFSMPSLLEKRCPHVVSGFAAAWDDFRYYWAVNDTAKALHSLESALWEADSLPAVKSEWAYRHLAAGKAAAVRQAASLSDSTVDLQMLYGDAFAEAGRPERARRHIEKAQKLMGSNPDPLRKWALDIRRDKHQWEIYRRLAYRRWLPDSTSFQEALYRTKIGAVRASIGQEAWTATVHYAEQLIRQPIREIFFDDYLTMIHHLSFQGETATAEQWIHKLRGRSLRPRHRDRLENEIEWRAFLIN